MNKQVKQLLLKDLCARLQYGVMIESLDGKPEKLTVKSLSVIMCMPQNEYLPYLRPLSSMTDDEQNEFDEVCDGTLALYDNEIRCLSIFAWADSYNSILKGIDWLDRKMFDHRITEGGETMIEAGLALPAPDGMYNVRY